MQRVEVTREDIDNAVSSLFKGDEAGVTYNRLVRMRVNDDVPYGQSPGDVAALLCDRLGIDDWPNPEGQAERLKAAIAEHHAQKADDRCIEDDDRLYAAAGLPPCDRRVGDKAAMLENCKRFIENRREGGAWPSYRELEAEVARLQKLNTDLAARVAEQSELLSRKAETPLRAVEACLRQTADGKKACGHTYQLQCDEAVNAAAKEVLGVK